jgi:CRISPR-associated protein (TIGR03985 family)
MNITDFPKIPTIGLLSILVPKELAARSQLSTALRRFLILAFIYNPPEESLPDTFSIYEWMENFSHDRQNASTSDLLQELALESLDLWIEDLLKESELMRNSIESALVGKPFDQSLKNFKEDFEFLSLTSSKLESLDPELKTPVLWLKYSGQDTKGRNIYSRLANLPECKYQTNKNDNNLLPLLSDEQELILEVLEAVAPMVPRLYPILQTIYPDLVLDSNRRLILDIDYVVPEKNSDVGDIQEKIRQLWKQTVIPPVAFTYKSSSQGKDLPKEIDCMVCPVCTRFYMRSQYLYAWGYNPRSEEEVGKKYDWYAYRLDHIENQSFKQLSWDDPKAIPLQLAKLYTPEDVMKQCKEAWGLDIEKPKQLLILRFNLSYYDRYIKGTNRGPSARKLSSYQEAIDILQDEKNKKNIDQNTLDLLTARIKARKNDAYYKANFRQGDHYTTMRLRSWCEKVEVLTPIDLRNKMIDDANLSICNYGYPSANTTL